MKLIDIHEADEPADEQPTYVAKDTAEVAQHVYPFLLAKIEKLNKRARKNHLPEIKLVITKEYAKQKPQDPKETLPSVEVPYYSVKLTGDAPKIAGYKFIATIEHQEGGNIIRTVPGEENNEKIKEFYEARPDYCDHCKKRRARIDTFIVKEEKTGKLRQVGRNCLADFLGGADPKAILWYFNELENFHKTAKEAEEKAGEKGIRGDTFIPLEKILSVGAALIRTFGYMSSKKAQELANQGQSGLPTTAGDARWAIFYAPYERRPVITDHEKQVLAAIKSVGPQDEQQAKTVIDWFSSLPEEQKQASEFMHNLDVIVRSGKVNPRNVGFAVALFPAYAYAMDLVKKREEVKKTKKNEHVGQVGQKIPPTHVKVIRTRNITGQFGTTQIVSMEDQEGRMFVWFNNGRTDMEEGKEYTITGTVKKHDEYNGRKQTQLTRVKFQ